MQILIKQAKIIDQSSPFNGKVKDILISNNIITSISDNINAAADMCIEEPGMHISIGWMDIFSHFCDPGLEHRETLTTGANAAATGGFTDVMVIPNTQPCIHDKTQVEYIVQKSKHLPVNIYPIGTITKNTEEKELAEMYDMQQFGAVAFSNGLNPVQNAGLLLKSLQYIKAFEGVIIQIPVDKSIAANGLMNEGVISTMLGLPGIPAIAEELIIARDLQLTAYTNSKIHFTGISTRRSIQLIKQAKKEGIKVTCSVAPFHLYFNDESLQDYDTNLKVNPPLRNEADRMALNEALKEGIIDCIASHHLPQNTDAKNCEFEYAKNGMTGLETLFSIMVSIGIELGQLINYLTASPRKIFNIPVPLLKEGEPACITLFNPDKTYVFEEKLIKSKSQNSPFVGKKLTGKVIGIINNNSVVLNKYE